MPLVTLGVSVKQTVHFSFFISVNQLVSACRWNWTTVGIHRQPADYWSDLAKLVVTGATDGRDVADNNTEVASGVREGDAHAKHTRTSWQST